MLSTASVSAREPWCFEVNGHINMLTVTMLYANADAYQV